MTKEEMIEDIRDRLSEGEELRDVAKYHGLSCRAVCRFMAEVPEEEVIAFDSSNFNGSEGIFIDPDLD